MLTQNSPILTLFTSLIWSHENQIINSFESSFHRSRFLNIFFEAYFGIY